MTKKTIYEWQIASLAKGIDPKEAVREFERIEKKFGALTPEYVLEASKAKKSVLHSLFNWDDTDAANKYRLEQARRIINNIQINVISDGQQRNVPAFEIVNTGSERMFKNVKDFNKDDIEQVRVQTVRELNSLRNKLTIYDQFNKVVGKLDEAIELF